MHNDLVTTIFLKRNIFYLLPSTTPSLSVFTYLSLSFSLSLVCCIFFSNSLFTCPFMCFSIIFLSFLSLKQSLSSQPLSIFICILLFYLCERMGLHVLTIVMCSHTTCKNLPFCLGGLRVFSYMAYYHHKMS